MLQRPVQVANQQADNVQQIVVAERFDDDDSALWHSIQRLYFSLITER